MTRLLHACGAGSRFLRHLTAILLLAGTAVAGNAVATTYRVVELPIPPSPGGTMGGRALDINAAGAIVGMYFFTDSHGIYGQYAGEWSPPDYAMRALPPSSGVTLRWWPRGSATMA